MKKHLVKILYRNVYGSNFIYEGFVNEVLNEKGKPVVFPCGIFKTVFGFSLPDRTVITLL